MAFNSFIGFFFAFGVVCLCWATPKRFRNAFLLASSFVFYAFGDPIYALLLLFVIFVGYFGAILLKSDSHRNITIYTSILLLLLVLGVFKYFNFFSASFGEILGYFGLKVDTVTLKILLPIGVSFYIFQTIGYLVDVFRGETDAETNFIDFALFVSFFPQLVAGPIERSRNLLAQVRRDRPIPKSNDVAYGFFLIVQGYAKKIVIADTLGPYADLVFEQDHLSAPLIFVGLLFFAFQIYGDFSGYTDIARGYSRLLGFRIILNFDRPYFATSPSNFWRRWHISLSSWFTEYLYIPLGGNRSRSRLRRSANTFATMGLSGLWHGASLNFIVWGLYHGALIMTQRVVQRWDGLKQLNLHFRTVPSRILTFLAALLGWLYFRIEDMDKLVAYHVDLVTEWSGFYEAGLLMSQGLVCLTAALIIDLSEKYWLDVHKGEVRRQSGLTAYLAGLLIFIALFAADASGSFIYFRF